MNVERPLPTDERPNETPPAKHWEPTAKYILVILVGLAALAIYGSISREREQTHAVASIPTDTRGALYARVLENLRFCRDQSRTGLERFCKGEAEFIISFPECGQECKELGRRFLSTPVR